MIPTSDRNPVSLARPAMTVARWCGLARAIASAVGDAQLVVHGAVDAQLDDGGDEGGRGVDDHLPVVRVERRPHLGEVGLGEADVAGFLEDVELGDLARHRVRRARRASSPGSWSRAAPRPRGSAGTTSARPLDDVVERRPVGSGRRRVCRPGGCTRRTSSSAGTRRRPRRAGSGAPGSVTGMSARWRSTICISGFSNQMPAPSSAARLVTAVGDALGLRHRVPRRPCRTAAAARAAGGRRESSIGTDQSTSRNGSRVVFEDAATSCSDRAAVRGRCCRRAHASHYEADSDHCQDILSVITVNVR